ncbi:hypothetical protein VTL71DRAFT_8531 [Oculimacula yallundae]|uniref:2EXR domain-containing protein n=1 Tax=Oculimacula yallundae TaxID=86028 RepID=A0ABR4CY13_9HELO
MSTGMQMAPDTAPDTTFASTEDLEAAGLPSLLPQDAPHSVGSVHVGEVSASAMAASTNSMPAGVDPQQIDDECRMFTLFPKLPIELRFKIWREAQPEPRVIDLIFPENKLGVGFSNATQPVLLSVCQESRSETLKIYKPVSESMKSCSSYIGCPIYIDPLDEVLLIADDSHYTFYHPEMIISLETIISWLNTDVLKFLSFLGIGLWMMETYIDIRPTEPALLSLSKFLALDYVVAVVCPVSIQRHPNVSIEFVYGAQSIRPPLLAPNEDSPFAVYIPDHERYVQQPPTITNPRFNELDEMFGLVLGDDRADAIEGVLEELYNEVYVVGLELTKWKKPFVGIGALEAKTNQQDRDTTLE